MNTAADTKLQEALLHYFGFNAFKGIQEQIIKSVLNRKDTLVIMPTGGGKSLCYQLPAILGEGTAIIISPLIALMKNQVDLVRGYSQNDNIAHFLNSSLSRVQIKQVKSDLTEGSTKMLYVAPETLTKPETIEFFKQIPISFIAVDEAHCISEWGHDFRPEYRRIRQMVDGIDEKLPIIALTATATPKVRTDIIKILNLDEPNIYIESFNRPNLYYEIRPKGKKEETFKQIIQFAKKNHGKSGIVYCLNRKTTEEIAEALNANGVRAAAYHAGLDSASRTERQDQFLMEDVQVIAATIAFGMGIDKPDVRFVIHYNMPKSLENYYQETGRAGRDGLEGKCIGFFSYPDMEKLEKFMRDKPVAERDIGGQHIDEVITYSESGGCRRRFLLHYFGEDYQEKACEGGCDNCANPKPKIEAKDSILTVLQTVRDLQENFDAKYVVGVLRGKNSQDVVAYKHNELPTFGKGEEQEDSYWNSIITHASLNGLLVKDIETYGQLKLSEAGSAYLEKPYSIQIALNNSFHDDNTHVDFGSSPRTVALDNNLLSMLKDLRKKVAKSKNVPTYVVFQDRSLEEMATYYPINIAEMERITGVSAGKASKYGKEFAEFIAQYVQDNQIERVEDFTVKTIGNKSKDKIAIIQYIDKKIPLDNIARQLQLSAEELLVEIEKIVDSGTKLNLNYVIDELLDRDAQAEIYAYLRRSETDALKAIVDFFEDEFSEEELRLMRIKFISEVAH